MNPARIVFPGFWFGQSDLAEALDWARRGVGGFCVYGAGASQLRDFVRQINAASPYGKVLYCADIKDNLSEIMPDVPALPANHALLNSSTPDAAYRKGNLLGRMARAVGIDWVLAPVVDLGYTDTSLGDDPIDVTRLAEDMIAGISNAGTLSCMKYFPGVSGALKTLAQLEEAECVPYKHLFRRADSIMPSDMVFPNLDNDVPALLSQKIIQGLLRKRLNYKGCVVSFPLHKLRVQREEEKVTGMLRSGVEILLAPRQTGRVLAVLENAVEKKELFDEVSHAISNLEMFVSKVNAGPEPEEVDAIFDLARHAFS